MRIAIYNCFAGEPLAETGLARRLLLASRRLGWEALETDSSAAINQFDPDFVLALHFFTPKLTKHPTYGCMWSPPLFAESQPLYVKHILSYDGYLCSSQPIQSWLENHLLRCRKPYFIAPFYTSYHSVPYVAPKLASPRLLYAGTNWDGPRHKELFLELDREPFVDVYGQLDAWRYLKKSYKGLIPVDGESIIAALRQSGAGLCLHKREHREAATPSLRIFEIAASGAVAICEEHPFIRSAFGDSVLYLSDIADAKQMTREIRAHVNWITNNSSAALELSRRAYQLFAQHYTLEKLLTGIIPFHERLNQKSSAHFIGNYEAKNPASVDVVLPLDKCDAHALAEAIQSIAKQTYRIPRIVIAKLSSISGVEEIVSQFKNKLAIEIIDVPTNTNLLSAGLQIVSAPYFTVLSHNERFYPDHLSVLLQEMEQNPQIVTAVCGAVRIFETAPFSLSPWIKKPDPAGILFLNPVTTGTLQLPRDLQVPNLYLARSNAIEPLRAKGLLEEITSLKLLAYLLQLPSTFSCQVTMEAAFSTTIDGSERRQNNELKDLQSWVRKTTKTLGSPRLRLEWMHDIKPQRPPLHRRLVRLLTRAVKPN